MSAFGKGRVAVERCCSKLRDVVGMLVPLAVVGAVMVGFCWGVYSSVEAGRDEVDEAEEGARRVERELFLEFTALSPSAFEDASGNEVARPDIKVLGFDSRSGRTQLTITFHRQVDSHPGQDTRMQVCYDYTLMRPGAGTSSYREVECPKEHA